MTRSSEVHSSHMNDLLRMEGEAMDFYDGLDYGLGSGFKHARRRRHTWALSLVLLVVASMLFTSQALGLECEIVGGDDFFKTPCDIAGTYVTPPAKIFGVTATSSDLTMELTDTSTTVRELGNSAFSIPQTRVLMTYTGTLRVPMLRFDSSRPIGDRVTASSRIEFFINGAIEWREDVRGGTGRIEGGAWAPENPPDADGNPAPGVAGRVEFISFDATLNTDSLPCCEIVGGDSRMSFSVQKNDEVVQTDLGLGRGIRFSGRTTVTLRESPDISWTSPSEVTFDLGSVQPLVNINPTGTITGRLTSTDVVDTLTGTDIEKATILLLRQDGFVRNQRGGESDEEYREFLESREREQVDQCINCDLIESDGQFSFENVPFFVPSSSADTNILQRAYYSIDVTDAESEERALIVGDAGQQLGETTETLLFTNHIVRNIRPDPQEPFEEHEIKLTPLDEIAKKEKLVIALSQIGPNQYSPVEEEVQQFLETVKNEQTPEQLEAVRRGILAERLVLSSAKFAEPLITTMLGGFENLVKDLIDELKFKKGDALTEGEKKLNALQKQLDAEKLKQTGFQFTDSDAANKIKRQMGDLIGSDTALRNSFVGKLGKHVSKAIFTLVKEAMTLAKVKEGPATEVASNMETMANTVFGIIIAQSAGGGRKAIAKRLIHEVLKDQTKTLLDGRGFVSYTSLTEESLEATLKFMEGWNVDNKEAFLLDRGKFNEIDQEMGERVLVTTGGITAYSTEIADALGGFGGDVIDAIGDLGGPAGKALKLGVKVVKYASNTTTFGMPFITIYGILAGPDIELPIPFVVSPVLNQIFGDSLQLGLVGKGVARAFGEEELPDTASQEGLSAARDADMTVSRKQQVGANGNLISAIDQSQMALNSVIDALISALQEDRIEDVVALVASADVGNDSFIRSSAQLERSVMHVIAMVHDALLTSEDVAELIGKNADVMVASAEATQVVSDLLFNVLLLEYEGPKDRLYVAERNHVITILESFKSNAGFLATDATTVFNENKDSITLPALVIDHARVSSVATGGDTVTSSPEDFMLTAHVKNLSASAVSDLSAMVTVTSMEDVVVISTPAEMVVGSGTLEADDGANGTGADEADVVWQFTYNGDPSRGENVLFVVDLLENGEIPATFRAFGEAATLEPDIRVTDTDLDGMPDEWERANGLDTTKDDSDDDADNDGLTNQREFHLGTDPQNPDTDGDGLSDGEETTGGEDGFVTDPLNMDTDDDGVPDAADGQPVDGGTSDIPEMEDRIGEPEVSVDTTAVALTKDEPIATVRVTNSGTGMLTWTAVSNNDAIATVSPSGRDLRNGDGEIIITAPASFDFDAVGRLTTTVHVIDLTGATHDIQSIAVSLGTAGADALARVFVTVEDDQGEPIAQAKIRVKHRVTKEKIKGVTDENGEYASPFIDPADYKVICKKAGFEKVKEAITLAPGEERFVNCLLGPLAVEQ